MTSIKINLKIGVVLATLILLLFSVTASAQHRSDHWYLGDSAAIHFTDTGVVASTDGSLFSIEGCASISDTLGNLLFYTNGWRIWNRNGQIMPNGDSIVEWSSDWVLNEILTSVTQSTIILPYPEYEGKYVVFTNQSTMLSSDGTIPPRYSVIDMNLDGGLGDIEIHEKSKFIQDSILTVEKLCATKHANGRDWWILLWGRDVSSSYGFGLESDSTILRFLLTPEGLSYLGPQYVGYVHNAISQGEMVFSQSGDKLAIAGWLSVEVRDFDRCTGLIGPRILIDTAINSAYGAEFSPDGRKLYVSDAYSPLLYQYDLNLSDQDSSYRQIVFDGPSNLNFGQLQLGPDNKIYFPASHHIWPNDIYSPATTSLSVIHNPNCLGIVCDIDTFLVDLVGKRGMGGLPNQPNYELGALIGSHCDTLGGSTGIHTVPEPKPEILVYPQPATGILTVVVPEILEGKLHIELFDYAGKLVRKSETPADQYSLQLSVEGLAEGLYILSITEERGTKISQTITIKQD